jgi:hypothetical protein
MDIKIGQDTKGQFAIIYGRGGVQWVRGRGADALAKQSGLSLQRPAEKDGSLHIAAAGQILEAVSELGQWYEMRQMRLIQEAHYEEQRIPWLLSCANLVLNDITANGRLDSKAAYYLSRDASGLFEACVKNPKIYVPGSVLYMCYGIQKQLAKFNAASNDYLSSVLRQEGTLTTGSSIFGEGLKKIFGDTRIPDDASWLKYHSAEEQLEAMLELASEKKSVEIDWKDIAKSSVLLAAFIPIPAFWGAGIAARTLFTIGGMARGAAVSYSLQPLSKIVKGIYKNMNDTKQIQMFVDLRDLFLLKLEANNTARLIEVQSRLLEGTEQKELVLLGQEPIPALPAPEEIPENSG